MAIGWRELHGRIFNLHPRSELRTFKFINYQFVQSRMAYSIVLTSNRVFRGSTTCAPTLLPTLIPILQSWKPEVGPLFSSWDPNRRRNHDLAPTLCPNFALQITCQLLTVELGKPTLPPTSCKLGNKLGSNLGSKLGPSWPTVKHPNESKYDINLRYLCSTSLPSFH